MSELDNIIQKQRAVLAHLQVMNAGYNQKPDAVKTRGYLTSLLQELETLHSEFKSKHDEIYTLVHNESINTSDVPYFSENCYYQFTDSFTCFKGDLIDLLTERIAQATDLHSSTLIQNSSSNNTGQQSNTEPKLPKISLPKFSGDYLDWISFQDIYDSLVHSNNSIPKVQKFYYLKGSLTGEAANLIKTISASEANYDSAWLVLRNRYHNKRLIVDTLIRKLFDIPKSNGTSQSIKLLLDSAQESISSLNNLEISTATWDPFLIYLLANKLDVQTRKEWEKSLKTTEIPTIKDMFSFLEQTFRTLESVHDELPSSSKSTKNKQQKSIYGDKLSTNHVFHNQNCLYCEKSHALSKCFKFLALPHKSKIEFLVKKHICCNCLSSGHKHTECKSLFRCHVCKKLHHTLLHVEDTSTETEQPINSHTLNVTHSLTGSASSNISLSSPKDIPIHNTHCFSNVLLSTIRLIVKANKCQYVLRALLDQGSQSTLITESAVQLLNLPKQRVYCKVSGVGDTSQNLCRSSVNLNIWSLQNQHILTCSALVLNNLSAYVPKVSAVKVKLNENLIKHFADPHYFHSDPIDIILGSDIFSKIALPGQSFIEHQLFFQNTYFGWVLSGPTENLSESTLTVNNLNIETILRSFWEQEEIVEHRNLTEEEQACEKFFQSTTERTSSGRYVVKLPFKSLLLNGIEPTFQATHIGALRRFNHLEHSFAKNSSFCEKYKLFMNEYENLNHMSKIGTYPADVHRNSYFLPHHGVLKESSTTTKLRVVFDGSHKTKCHTSMNDELCAGPALQNDLPEVLSRWRKHKFAFCADIEKMFRQIQVASQHRQFQQILWRYNPKDAISIYKLNTVTYGTTSAPYLSIRVLQQIAKDYQSMFPKASNVLIHDCYVDDIISGSDNLADVIHLHHDLCALLQQGECKLRKWISNSSEFMEQISPDLRESSQTLNFSQDNVVKALGVQWNTASDTFSLVVTIDSSEEVTKRSILSCSARLFDPL